MTIRRTLVAAAGAALLLFSATACAGTNAKAADAASADIPTVRVAGATSNPLEQASIEYVRDKIAPDYGIKIDYVHIEETRAILDATEAKEVDANVAMHKVYMDGQNEALGLHLAAVAPLFEQRQVLYSKKYKSLDDVPDGAQIAVSTSPVAISTALKFLEAIKLVKLDPKVPLADITVDDVTDNPKHLKFVTVDSVPRALDDVDLATATAFAFYTAEVDKKYEIAGIQGLPEYALQLVVHQDNVDRPDIKKLIQAFNDPRLDDFVKKNWSDLVTPL